MIFRVLRCELPGLDWVQFAARWDHSPLQQTDKGDQQMASLHQRFQTDYCRYVGAGETHETRRWYQSYVVTQNSPNLQNPENTENHTKCLIKHIIPLFEFCGIFKFQMWENKGQPDKVVIPRSLGPIGLSPTSSPLTTHHAKMPPSVQTVSPHGLFFSFSFLLSHTHSMIGELPLDLAT